MTTGCLRGETARAQLPKTRRRRPRRTVRFPRKAGACQNTAQGGCKGAWAAPGSTTTGSTTPA
eukprot:2999345-Lingulodinium_polyedra.AAC.1